MRRLVNVLLTGDSGFIGRNMRRHLEAADHTVTGVDIAYGTDVRDYFKNSNRRFDLVIHCAAVVGGRRQIEGEPMSLAVDLSIDAEMFNWAMRTHPGRVVYFSSSAAYPTVSQQRSKHVNLQEDLIDLDDVKTPDHVYGWVKLTGELLARHARAAGLSVLVIRPFSGYGTDQDLSYPFPAFIDRARRGTDPFEVWGDGEQVRDFIHVDDVCRGVLAAIREGAAGPVNLGTGRAVSFNQLADIVTREAGYRPAIKHQLDEPVGVQYRVANIQRMLEIYKPRVSLEEGVRRALANEQ